MVNKLVFENLKFRPVRTALSVIAIGIEVTMMLTIVGLSQGMLADSQRRARGSGADIFIRAKESSAIGMSAATIPVKLVNWIRKRPHVVEVVGMVTQPTGGISTITGIDLPAFTRMSGGFHFVEGHGPRQKDDLIVDEYYARQNHVMPGSRVNVLNREWNVSGVFEEGKLARWVLPLEVLQDLTSNSDKLGQILVKVDDPARTQQVIDDLKQMGDYKIYSVEEFVSLFSVNNVPGLKWFIWVIVGLSIVVGFLVVFLSMYTAVLERTREIGILKALGASPQMVLSILVRETFLLAVIGAVVGIVLTYGTRWLIMTLVPASLTQQIVPLWWPIAGGIAVLGAMLGTAYPGWRAARQDPIEALSYE